jgi:glycosyltransferase involved in cell wall biosynthesis
VNVLLIHNLYQQYGGEDAVVPAERKLLEEHGNEVTSYTRHNDEIKRYTFLQKLTFPSNTVYSVRTTKELTEIVEKSGTDAAYIHNVFPLISPSVYHTLHSLKVPSLQVVHGFRLFCPNTYFHTNGHICERCKRGNYLNAVRYRCYRDSYTLSALYAASIGLNRLAGMLRKTSAFICLTEFARLKLLEAGLPEDKLFIKPHFIDAARVTPCPGGGNYVVYLGRLSSEKGLWTLLRAFEALKDPLLKILGTGPLEAALKGYVRERGITNIEFVGFKTGPEKWELLKGSLLAVVPSECYETFGMVVLEAYAAGKPVVASDIGGLSYIVRNGKSGMLFQPGSVADLTEKVRYLIERPAEIEAMGRYGRQLVETEYGPDRAYMTLMGIFDKVRGNDQEGHSALHRNRWKRLPARRSLEPGH